MSDKKLLQQFVDSFQRLDDLFALEEAPPELRVEQELDEWDRWTENLSLWQPKCIETNPDRLEPLYSRIAGRFPVMYEQLEFLSCFSFFLGQNKKGREWHQCGQASYSVG